MLSPAEVTLARIRQFCARRQGAFVLAIYKAINLLLPQAESADAWVRRPNDAPLFKGRSALEYMLGGEFEDIVDAANFATLLEIEALTNPRVREEAGAYRKVRPEDAIAGPGATPIMASFVYSGPSRFCDGTYGVYYAAREEATAVAESRYHTEAFLRATHQPSIDVDKRLYAATIDGEFDDIRERSMRSKLYAAAPDDYGYAHRLYARNRVDGIVYNSVRNPGGGCVAAFRPRIVSKARIRKYIQFRWDGRRIAGVVDLVNIRE